MQRGLPAAVVAALLMTSIARAEVLVEEFWVEYPNGMYLVGEVRTNAQGAMTVQSLYLSAGENGGTTTMYAVPFIDVRAGGLLDQASVESWGGYALMRAYKLDPDRALMAGEWFPTAVAGGPGGDSDPDGTGGDGGNGTGGTHPPPSGNPFHPFVSLMIYDMQDQWASFLNVYITQAIELILEALQAQPSDWGAGGGNCIPPAPPGNPTFRMVTPAGTLETRHWGDPMVPADNSITVFPIGQPENCLTYQTLPDFPDPGPGPGNVRWMLKNFDVDMNRPAVDTVPPLGG